MTIKNPLTEVTFKLLAANHKRRYEKMIKQSQAKLAETKLVPGYTNIYA